MRKAGRLFCAAAISLGLAVGELALSAHWSEPAFAKGNGGGNGGGNSGNGGGSGGGGGGNAGAGNNNAGGNGNSNAGAGNNNAGGNGKGKGASAAAGAAEDPASALPDTALELRTTGQIKPLAEVYQDAERRFGGKVVDARLVGDEASGWTYDVRVRTEDGYVRDVSYNATNLAVRSIDGQPVQ
jgi:hypothetical protein